MAAFALLDVDLYADELDLSCFTQTVGVTVDAVELDATTFCSAGWQVPIAGIRGSTWTASGPTDMATATASQLSAVDQILAVDIGSQYVLSAIPAGGTAGNVGYFTTGRLMTRTPITGTVGDLATHDVSFRGNNPTVRGTLADIQTIVATGDGSEYELGAVSATQRVWAAVHFLTAGGTTPSIEVKIQSDVDDAFGSPVDQITFSAATAKGAQFSSTVGAITDTWWRAVWTVSGTNPSFQTRILIGIQ